MFPLLALPLYHMVSNPRRTSTFDQHEKWGLVILTTLRYNHGRHGERPAVKLHQGADGQQTHCEGKGANAMSDIPNDDKPGFVAENPERLSWPEVSICSPSVRKHPLNHPR
jgi:hypothetical protein